MIKRTIFLLFIAVSLTACNNNGSSDQSFFIVTTDSAEQNNLRVFEVDGAEFQTVTKNVIATGGTGLAAVGEVPDVNGDILYNAIDIDQQAGIVTLGDYVIAVNTGAGLVADVADPDFASISVFRRLGNGELNRLGAYATDGVTATSIATYTINNNPDVMAYVYVGHQAFLGDALPSKAPSISVFAMNHDGALELLEEQSVVFEEILDVIALDPSQAQGITQLAVSPTDNVLVASFAARDDSVSDLRSFTIATATGELQPVTTVTDAFLAGSIGFAWNAQGNLFYLTSFISNTLTVFAVKDNGELLELQRLDLTAISNGREACWAVLSNDGDHLYIDSFLSNTVSVLAVNELTGLVKYQQTIARPDINDLPLVDIGMSELVPLPDTKDMVISADGDYLYLSGAFTRRFFAFPINNDGSLANATRFDLERNNNRALIGLAGFED